MKDLIKKIIARLINVYRKSSVRPFRNTLYKLYLKYIEPKMITDRCAVVERDGIRYKLDLKDPQENEIYYTGHCEPTVTNIINKYLRPEMIAFDLGAHTGSHTLRMAKLVGKKGKIIAVDLDSQVIPKLKYNLKLNNADNVMVENIAFSDVNKKKEEMTLDEYVKINKIDKIDFIKMDTEGSEYKIIKGGIESIKKFSPIMVLEFSRTNLEMCGDRIEDLVDLLKSLDYSIFSEKNLKEYSSRKALLDSMPLKTTKNVLCKIKEKS